MKSKPKRKSSSSEVIDGIVRIAKGGRGLCIYLPDEIAEKVEHGEKYYIVLEPAKDYAARIIRRYLGHEENSET